MLRLSRLAALCLCLSIAAPAAAQQHDEQIWTQVNTHVPLAKNARITLEQIARFSDRQEGLYQTEFGALIGIKLSPQIELGLGYRKVGTHNRNDGAPEDRLRQQLVGSFGPLTTRFRVDERFNPRGGEIGFRIRPLLRYNVPLGEKKPVLFVSHESFFLPNSTSWGQRSGYERMRNIFGVTFAIGSDANVDIGYLNQYRFARGDSRAQMDHALNLQLTINLKDLILPDIND